MLLTYWPLNVRRASPNMARSSVLFILCFTLALAEDMPALMTPQSSRQAALPDDVFSSAAHVHRTFLIERQIANFLRTYVASVEAKLTDIKRYLDEYTYEIALEGAGLDEQQFLDKVVGNPIYAFRMVKRFAVDLEKIWNAQLPLDSRYLETEINRIRSSQIPGQNDLAGAAYSLARVQHTYNLNVTDFTRGFVWGISSRAGLTAMDTLYIGRVCYNHGLHARAVEWFEETLRLTGLERNPTVSQETAMKYLAMAIHAHDFHLEKLKREAQDDNPFTKLSPAEGGSLYPESVRVKPPALQQMEMSSSKKNYCLGINCTGADEMANYNALCRGEKMLSDKVIATFNCRLDKKSHPAFFINPAKIEYLHRNPDLILFHDLVTDKQIARLKEMTEKSLHRSGVVNDYDIQTSKVSEVRTSKNTWLEDTDDPLVLKMTRQVGRLTGLSMRMAEKFQIANYGIGGHFQNHYDALYANKDPKQLQELPEDIQRMGDRIATLMYYLTDVARGGATVFPKLGVGTWPVKGGAVFWHNMMRNGTMDPLTLHAACPVVHGSKWVANKWIRIGDQMHRRPCTLNPEE